MRYLRTEKLRSFHHRPWVRIRVRVRVRVRGGELVPHTHIYT